MKTNTTEMQATVTEINITDSGLYANAICGKVSACVCINDYQVRVICQNAAHKVWRGAGRAFATVAEALAAYKSSEMRAIIAAVDRRNA
jgi:DNA-binding protein H-NS